MSKFCRKCNIERVLIDYYTYSNICKHCHKEVNKLYRDNNKESIKLRQKSWESKNKESRNKKRKTQIKEKRKNDPLFAIRSSISRNIRQSLKRNGFSKSTNTQLILGCSFDKFKLYLESKFEHWMTWENRGLYNGELNYGWDIDHIIPISTGLSEDEIIKLNHYTNLQPLCSKFNRDIKRDKIV